MTFHTAIARPMSSLRVGLLGMVLIAATAFSAGIGLGASNWLARVSVTETVGQPAPAFDASGFRLQEKLP